VATEDFWNTTEFWDYSCSVEISAPTNLIDSSDTSMLDIVKDLWRMRRDYRKDHGVRWPMPWTRR
jgi:hypothetical protein